MLGHQCDRSLGFRHRAGRELSPKAQAMPAGLQEACGQNEPEAGEEGAAPAGLSGRQFLIGSEMRPQLGSSGPEGVRTAEHTNPFLSGNSAVSLSRCTSCRGDVFPRQACPGRTVGRLPMGDKFSPEVGGGPLLSPSDVSCSHRRLTPLVPPSLIHLFQPLVFHLAAARRTLQPRQCCQDGQDVLRVSTVTASWVASPRLPSLH